MRRLHWEDFTALAPQMSGDQRRAVSVAGVAHALHDGYTDLVYIMLPLWQAEFGLTYAALGLLRSVLVGAMACLQIPAGIAAERFGAAVMLALGTALAGLGFCFAGMSAGFATLLGALLICGIGSSTQHPIASALVARAFAGPRSLKALGTYNFTGDLGKMTLPATLSLMLLVMAWRPALAILGGIGHRRGGGDLYRHAALPAWRDRPSAEQYECGARAQAATLRVSRLGRDRRHRHRHAHGIFAVSAVRAAKQGRERADYRLGADAGFHRRRGGKARLHLYRRADRRRRNSLADRGLDGGRNSRVVSVAARRRPLLLPLIGVALNGTSSVLYGSVPELVTAAMAQPRAEYFLYRRDRFRRDRADPVRPSRRRARRVAGFDAGGGIRAVDAAVVGAAARRDGTRIRFPRRRSRVKFAAAERGLRNNAVRFPKTLQFLQMRGSGNGRQARTLASWLGRCARNGSCCR